MDVWYGMLCKIHYAVMYFDDFLLTIWQTIKPFIRMFIFIIVFFNPGSEEPGTRDWLLSGK